MRPSPAKFIAFRLVAGLAGWSVVSARLLRRGLVRMLIRKQDPYCQAARFFDARELE